MTVKQLLCVCFATLLSTAADVQADMISTSEYSLSGLDGEWHFGSTGYNQSIPVDNVADLSGVASLMSDGYVDDFGGDNGATNGVYSWPFPYFGQLTFEFNGGTDFLLDEFSFISSRAYSPSTDIHLEYRLNGGAWQTATTSTTASLGMYPAIRLTYSPGAQYSLDFGSVLADSFRLTFDGADQVSIHEVSVSGISAVVPEPATLALAGIGAISFFASGVFRRKRF